MSEDQKLCAAIACGMPISATQFACPKHWVMIPRYLRVDIWATRYGNADASRRDSATRRAIFSIAEQEGLAEIAELRFRHADKAGLR